MVLPFYNLDTTTETCKKHGIERDLYLFELQFGYLISIKEKYQRIDRLFECYRKKRSVLSVSQVLADVYVHTLKVILIERSIFELCIRV